MAGAIGSLVNARSGHLSCIVESALCRIRELCTASGIPYCSMFYRRTSGLCLFLLVLDYNNSYYLFFSLLLLSYVCNLLKSYCYN